ncbi:ribosomal protein L11 methyltransferase [Desulfonispora thiosulfatigenes DSM 11270]|uniref:Ribosomal protein L11 methyltransferase n=1 Tax=Desulfonispora thiosulfatigenes DSM 11270 TaxID=656914 RepID=A0A1W1VCG0_DESTI|nr:50S ribosomal protein L11 methyltransferase [Desulfonispora thiosulfatigenes]SMB90903.1 ribosomal protein L11 methyltransferase [Desulfonispora thiosulfatigenes DSM 11270]
MNWLEVKVTTVQEAIEGIANIFHEIGAGGVVIEDPQLISIYAAKGTWDAHDFTKELLDKMDVVVKGYLPVDEFIFSRLEELKLELELLKVRIGEIPTIIEEQEVKEEDWANSWKIYFKPEKIGEKTVIKPSWENYKEKPGDLVIELDPGMAFGTGNHATTSLCINLLEKYVKPEMNVIDVGCGSGILSILAAKLEAKNVEALDFDNVAVRVAKENVVINNLQDSNITVCQSDLLQKATLKADLIVANIVADIIIRMIPSVQNYLTEKGILICSGIIDERKDDVIKALEEYDFKTLEIKEKSGWVAIVVQSGLQER